jgi:hypothetical protein
MFITLVSCLMLLIKFLFRVKIMELEKRLTKVVNELKSMKEEAAAKKEEANRLKKITKDMMARWMKDDGGQGCSKDATKE